MPEARRIVVIVLLVQVAWSLPLGLVLGIVLDRAFLVAFGGVTLAVLVVLLSFMLVWQRADARRAALLATGTRVPATLISSRPTGTRIHNRRVLAHTFEAGQAVRAVAKAFAHLPAGTEATIAYDAANPTDAVVVEDLDRLAAEGRLDRPAPRGQEIHGKFRQRP